MKKLLLILCFLSAFLNAQITQLDQWKTKGNTFTTNTNYLGTNNSRSLVIKTNSTQVGKIDSVGKWTIGTGTVAANTSSLGIVRIKQGSSWIDFGEGSSGISNIWFNQSTPSASNYLFYGTSTTSQLNASTHFYTSISGIVKTYINSSGMRIGGSTAPSATLDVTGTMSVSSTMTLTGAAKMTNTLNYEGNTTWVTDQTNTLTTGNTGTVAVLSDAVFSQNFICMYSVNPTDATTYYFSNMLYPSWLTSTSGNSVVMPYNATLVGYSLNYIVNGTLGSAESGTLQIIASGSATDLNTALSYTSSTNSYTATNLSVSVAAGNLISAVIKTPTWVTDPTNLRMGITFWFVRRQ